METNTLQNRANCSYVFFFSSFHFFYFPHGDGDHVYEFKRQYNISSMNGDDSGWFDFASPFSMVISM